MRKKWLSLFMALVMIFSCITPVSVFAEEDAYTPGADSGTNTYHLDSTNFDTFQSSFATYVTWTIKLHENLDLSGNTYTAALFNANFSGTFDGGGHTISGLTVNYTASTGNVNVGLFSQLSGTVQNLRLENVSVTTSGYPVGAVAGSITGGATISGVTLENAAVRGRGQVGGIAGVTSGASNLIENCDFDGTVTSTGLNSTGGIVGQIASGSIITIRNCVNSGTVSAGNLGVGGIVGYALGTGTLSSCRNTGNVTSTAQYGIGGIVGHMTSASTISGCANSGTVTATTYGAGGIVGNKRNATKVTVSSCLNTGAVSSTGDGYVGGILGRLFLGTEYGTTAAISGCLSTGTITTSNNASTASGIVGAANASDLHGATIENLKLTDSTVTSDAPYVGAIVGQIIGGTSTITGAYSDATVSGAHMSGGLIGYVYDSNNKVATTVTLSDSWFDGSVTVSDRTVGGLIGQVGNNQVTLTVTDCLFTGTVTSETVDSTNVGGLVGRVHAATAVTLTDSVSAD